MASMMDEALADYNFTVVFIPGEKNIIADTMSCYSFSIDSLARIVAGISEVSISTDFVSQIKTGYTSDTFCVQALKNVKSVPGWKLEEGLLYFEDHILVPAEAPLHEALLYDAHDALGHLGIARCTRCSRSPSFGRACTPK
jgi:hypothetical protein